MLCILSSSVLTFNRLLDSLQPLLTIRSLWERWRRCLLHTSQPRGALNTNNEHLVQREDGPLGWTGALVCFSFYTQPGKPPRQSRVGWFAGLDWSAVMLNVRILRCRSALIRECMAEFLGTFTLLVSWEATFFLKYIPRTLLNFFAMLYLDTILSLQVLIKSLQLFKPV